MAEGKRVSLDMSDLIKGSDNYKELTINAQPEVQDDKPKRGRPRKDANANNLPMVNEQSQRPLTLLESGESYMTAYMQTNKQLDLAIDQLDALNLGIVTELQSVKNSKTLKNKYGYINDMTATAANIIGNKISAIREKNKTINDANNMDLRRMKELKLNENVEDDNQRIINLYDAFINTPIGVGGAPAQLGPSLSSMTVNGGLPPEMNRMQLGTNDYNDMMAQTMWEQNLNPAEQRMILDAQGRIETVVFYDQATGNRWFEVVDKVTKQPMPGVEKPSNDFIFELDINVRGGFAKDSNKNIIYPLIVINGGDQSITEY